MVWAGMMMDGRTDLHFFGTGSVTGQRYRDEVLEPYVRLFQGAVGPDFIFMDDNAPCHRAVLVEDFLETENIQRMSWPANSPDLNPIEPKSMFLELSSKRKTTRRLDSKRFSHRQLPQCYALRHR
ncbi:Transposable element Tc3 transposase, partial [Stegodyphus mimosarum]